MTKEYLTVEQFANIMKICSHTVYRAIKSGRLKAFRVGFGKKASWRISSYELERMEAFDAEEMIANIVQEKIKKRLGG